MRRIVLASAASKGNYIGIMRAAGTPMEHKMQLAHLIVRDFHTEGVAGQGAADFDREVRQHDVPADIETQKYPSGTVKVPRMLQDTGLAPRVDGGWRGVCLFNVGTHARRHPYPS